MAALIFGGACIERGMELPIGQVGTGLRQIMRNQNHAPALGGSNTSGGASLGLGGTGGNGSGGFTPTRPVVSAVAAGPYVRARSTPATSLGSSRNSLDFVVLSPRPTVVEGDVGDLVCRIDRGKIGFARH
jgi:hypothetical protein